VILCSLIRRLSVKFYDRRPSGYSRDAIGNFGKIFAAIIVTVGTTGVVVTLFCLDGLRNGEVAALVTSGAMMFVLGSAFLALQKSITVDTIKKEIRIEALSGFLRRTVAVYPFDSAVSVILYALPFGAKKSGILYACAIRTSTDEMIIFNPGLRDAKENGRIALAVAGMLGVKVLTGKIGEEQDE